MIDLKHFQLNHKEYFAGDYYDASLKEVETWKWMFENNLPAHRTLIVSALKWLIEVQAFDTYGWLQEFSGYKINFDKESDYDKYESMIHESFNMGVIEAFYNANPPRNKNYYLKAKTIDIEHFLQLKYDWLYNDDTVIACKYFTEDGFGGYFPSFLYHSAGNIDLKHLASFVMKNSKKKNLIDEVKEVAVYCKGKEQVFTDECFLYFCNIGDESLMKKMMVECVVSPNCCNMACRIAARKGYMGIFTMLLEVGAHPYDEDKINPLNVFVEPVKIILKDRGISSPYHKTDKNVKQGFLGKLIGKVCLL
jgi:hypothetical protein